MDGNDKRKNKDDNKEVRLSVNSPRPDGIEVDHHMEAAPRRPLSFLSQMGDAPGGPSLFSGFKRGMEQMKVSKFNRQMVDYLQMEDAPRRPSSRFSTFNRQLVDYLQMEDTPRRLSRFAMKVPQLSLEGTYSGKEIIKSESVQDFSAINQSELINVALATSIRNLEQLGLRVVSWRGGRVIFDWIDQPSEMVSLRTAPCCMTCKRQFSCSRQFPRSKSFCLCHRKLTPIIGGPKSPPACNPFGEGTSTMNNNFASDLAFQITLGHTLRRPMPNVSDETRPSQASESPPTVASDSPPTVKNCTQHWVVNVPFNDGDIQTGDTPTSVRGQGGPPPVLQGDSSSSGVRHEDSNIQPQGGHSSDRVPSEQRLGDYCFYHHAHEDNWQRLISMVDPFIAVNVQAACSLVAYKKSDGSSPAKDVLFYLLVTVYVLGFLSAFASKWFRCYKMGVIGLVATVLGFLMTLALVVIYKIG